MSFLKLFASAFPVPSYLSMPAVGLDISDHSVKFIEFQGKPGDLRVKRYGTKEIPEGVIVGGTIARRDELIGVLSELRREHRIRFVRASLPEEPAYVFTAHVPDLRDEDVRSLLRFKLEESVPIAPSEAVVDFDVVPNAVAENNERVAIVSVFPEKLAQDYVDLLRAAGLFPLSFEIEAQAIARAVVPRDVACTCLVVDVGRTRSGISIVSDGVVRFTTTIDLGGDALSKAVQEAFPDMSEKEIVHLKNTEGLRHQKNPKVAEAFSSFARLLRNEMERYYIYWHTHLKEKGSKADTQETIDKIILLGGNANMAGLVAYLSHELFITTERANVWQNVTGFDAHIPPISYEDSLGYASAIGLALHADK